MGGNHKKKYEVVKATRRETFEGVEIKGEVKKFGRSGGLRLSDEAEAREVQQRYGYGSNPLGKGGTGEVTVIPVDDVPVEPGHNYTHVSPGVPWGSYDELGRRIYPEEAEGQMSGESVEVSDPQSGDAARAKRAKRQMTKKRK